MMLLGFLFGMKHALEGDHIAAVAALASKRSSFREVISQGIVWGVGHTITLFLFGTVVILLNTSLPEQFADWTAFSVGAMLVLLGADVLRRAARDRIHFHPHRHGKGEVHLHAHSHQGEKKHDPSQHSHQHEKIFPYRALIVGLMHGMAGSAALILLTATTSLSPWLGLLYIAIFGFGSIIGMALFSVVIAIPLLQASSRGLTWMHNGFQVMIGLATVFLGLSTMFTIYGV